MNNDICRVPHVLLQILCTDPHHVQDYMKHNVFLPKLNQPSMDYRNNFLQIEELVLIGGPDDGVITPWQSR